MDYGQRNPINKDCYGCKYIKLWGSRYTCGNKYACINNNKKKKL